MTSEETLDTHLRLNPKSVGVRRSKGDMQIGRRKGVKEDA